MSKWGVSKRPPHQPEATEHAADEAGERDYFAQSASWAMDAQLSSARTRRVAWIVAGLAVAVALFEALALMFLTPLKTVQPVTLLVDRHTGYVQSLDPNQPMRVSADAALTDAYLAQYVMAREGFDRATVSLDYRKIALWSAGPARSSYLSLMPATNPDSPFTIYPGGTMVVASIKSVSRLTSTTALVRFDTRLVDRNGQAGAAQPWISVVRFQFTNAPMAMADRLINPLGFQVTRYRRDAEAPPTPITPPVNLPEDQVSQTAPPRYSAVAASIERDPTPVRAVTPALRHAPRTLDAAITASPRGTAIVSTREIPLANLPMGSPLGPVGGPDIAAPEPSR